MERCHKNIVVIGAGSTGSSIAYQLSKAGCKVTLLDRGTTASGNTGRSSALIRTHYSNETLARMAMYSLRVFQDFGSIGYSGFTRTGMFFTFHGSDSHTAMENVQMLRSIGIDEQEIEPDGLKKFYPDIDTEGFDYVAYEPESGYADPVATANSYAEAAKSLGASIILNNEVTSIKDLREGALAHLRTGEDLACDRIVVATNTWTNDLLQRSGVDESSLLPITSSMHGIVYLRRPPDYTGLKPTLWDPPNLVYYKMEGQSLTAIGSLDPSVDRTPVDIHGFIPETVTQELMEDYVAKTASRLPGMKKATLVSSLTGFYDMTPDGQAIVDSLENIGLEHAYVCAGLSGHGFKLSPAFGKMVSNMITETDTDEPYLDWKQFSISRFRNNKLIKSKYSDIGTIY